MSRRNSLMVSRTLYQLGILTLLMSVIWVGFGAYKALNNTKVENVDKSLTEPMSLTLDPAVVDQLQNRLKTSNLSLPTNDSIETEVLE